MKRALSFLGALAVFGAVLVAGASGQGASVAFAAGDSCANAAFRTGASTTLPDCRAYEMVSPVDKFGTDIVTRCEARCIRTSLMQATPDGSKLSFSSYGAFGDAPSSLYSNQYIATRSSGGWSTHSINPPREESFAEFTGSTYYDLNLQIKGLSEDLSTAAVTDVSRPALTPDAEEGIANLYSRDNLTDTYHWIAGLGETFDPVDITSLPEVQNVSADGGHIVFADRKQLTEDAAHSSSGSQVYDYSGGNLHLVSIMPDGTAATGNSVAGSFFLGGNEENEGRLTRHSLSNDGERITWSTSATSPVNIFQRIDGTETKKISELTYKDEIDEVSFEAAGGTFNLGFNSGTPPEDTTDLPWNATATEVQEALEALASIEPGDVTVTGPAGGPYVIAWGGQYVKTNISLVADGKNLTKEGETQEEKEEYEREERVHEAFAIAIQEGPADATYWDASTDGKEVLYSQPGGTFFDDLYRVNVDNQTATLIGTMTAHGAHSGVIGASDDLSYIYFVSWEALAPCAEDGKPTIFLWHEGTTTCVATISPSDMSVGHSIVASEPRTDAARVTPDGQGLAFQSAGSPTGYDNRDVKNGEPDIEVYAYDAETDELYCASCNPTGARPNGQPLRKYDDADETMLEPAVWTAAFLQGVENETYYPRDLSDDGNRVFFNSYDGLALEDNNNQQDVYEWEAEGTGSCTQPGGCISLISSGESPAKSEFLDASADGRDVFFTTQSSLVPQDPGLIDIYDAKEGGGFEAPAVGEAPCEGDACQNLPAPPNDPTPASAASYSGPGNAQPKAKKRHHKRHHKRSKRHHKRHHGKGRDHARQATHRNG